MDDVARFDPKRRAGLFDEAGTRRGISSIVIEKDFWVCWTLKRIFAQKDAAHYIFKGGTSLSKAFAIIRRFSEDIDISIDRKLLGYSGDRDPATAPSGKKAKDLLETLAGDVQTYLREMLMPGLTAAVTDALGGEDGWQLTLCENAAIEFQYRRSFAGDGYEKIEYVRPSVRLEFGGRGELWPSESRSVTSYIAEDLPEVFSSPTIPVNVLAVERTFWEKVTLLHAEAHRPAESSVPERLSRHLYDVAVLADSEYGRKAIDSFDLLRAVAEHKSVFFRSAWASYETARPGTLRLLPNEDRITALKADYEKMSDMFFDKPLPFEQIIDRLMKLEKTINELRQVDKG